MDANLKRKSNDDTSETGKTENHDGDNGKKLKTTSDAKIKLKLGLQLKPKQTDVVSGKNEEKKLPKPVARVFCDDDDDEEEKDEMPVEAKMKMRNVGRNTPTSSGPNSYGKVGSLGFTDSRKVMEKKLFEAADELSKK